MASRETNVDAISLLKRDHEVVQGLFAEFRKFEDEETVGVDEVKQAIIDDACAMLKVHTQIEEEIFYPAARDCLPDEQAMFDEAQVDHDTAKLLITKIEDGGVTDPATCALFLQLADEIDDHVQEEETEMFPKVKKAGMDVAEVGKRLKARKEEIESRPGGPRPGRSSHESVIDRITDYLGPTTI